MHQLVRHLLALLGAAMLLAPAARAADPNANNERWQAVRKSLFEGRSISEDARGVIELETPMRAADAAVVPIAIRTQFPQTPGRYVRKIWLVIDKNPSPVGAIFSFTLEGAAHAHDISTILDKRGIAVRAGTHCAMPLMEHLGITASCRASFGLYNTRAEVDALVSALDLAHDLFA